MEHDAEDLLTPAEVSRLADGTITPATVRLWADIGKLPHVRTSTGSRLFRRSDVEHHLADRQVHGRAAGRRRG